MAVGGKPTVGSPILAMAARYVRRRLYRESAVWLPEGTPLPPPGPANTSPRGSPFDQARGRYRDNLVVYALPDPAPSQRKERS
jgi:hypothetical protein